MIAPQERNWDSIKSRLLATAGDVALCAGLGAIVEPYVVAFTHEHHLAISEIEGPTRGHLLDALDLCLASGLFPSRSLCVFEHGGRSPENTTACLEHCHLHIVDGRFDLRAGLVRTYSNAELVNVSDDASFAANAGYLLAGVYSGKRTIPSLLVRTPSCGSQFFRRLLAEQVGSISWNWRLSPSPEAALRLCELWSKHLPTDEGKTASLAERRRG
jgi:hypothetical protein